MLVSTHNLGSVPEFCDHVVLINRTVLAAGPIAEVFTEENLLRAFGGVLRHFRFDESTVQKHDGRAVTLLTDDERPLVFGKGGHVEYSQRRGPRGRREEARGRGGGRLIVEWGEGKGRHRLPLARVRFDVVLRGGGRETQEQQQEAEREFHL